MRKKILSLILLVTVCISGCGLSSSKGSSSGGGGVKILFTYSQEEGNAFRDTLAEGAQEYAESVGAVVECDYAENSLEKQIESIKSAQSNGYDAIMCIAEDASTARQLEAAAGDLPIVFVNNEPSSEYLKADKYIYAGSFEQDAGAFQAEYVWNKLGNPSSMNIVILEGEKGHAGAIGRTNAIKYFYRDNGVDANIVFMDYANWSDTEAYEKLDVFKLTNQSFDAIFCNNDTMALGAVKWLKDNGYDPSKYLVAGVDATADGCASIKAGDMYMTVLQDAQGQGVAAVNACAMLSKGQSISSIEGATDDLKYVLVPFVPVDASNVEEVQ